MEMMKVEEETQQPEILSTNPVEIIATTGPQTLKLPRTCSLSHLLEIDYFGSISRLFDDNANNQNTMTNINIGNMHHPALEKFQLGELSHQYMTSTNVNGNTPIFVNPAFQYQ